MKKSVLVLALLTLTALGFAAEPDAKNETRNNPLPSINCQFTFTAGAQNTFLRYCVTDGGNILGIESPQGHFMIPDDREGYGVCDQSTGVAYFDYGSFGASANWGPVSVVSHSAKVVKMARTTSDGIWTLTQTFTLVAGNSPMVKDTMTLKNNTAAARGAFLLRYADTDIDSDTSNNLDATIEAASAWNSVTTPNENATARGLMLQNVGVARVTHQSLAQNSPSGPDACHPFTNFPAGPLVQFDGSLALIYQAFVGGGAAATATVGYRAF
ncbi:MAG: hypothetical protein HY010_13445 [Acidobacteria bacterium]|nr:hypothetical protein [Acidobacteriota bacterium]